MIKTNTRILALAVALAAPVSVRAQNLVANGSFELGDFNNTDADSRPEYMLVFPGMNNIIGWSVTGSDGVHWTTGSVQNTTDGDKALDLQGLYSEGPFSSLSTLVPTIPGAHYILSFDASPGNNPNFAEVSVGTLANQTFSDDPNPLGPPSIFTNFQYEFTALASQSTLLFHVTASDGYGPVIDNVSVTQVPEPSTSLLTALCLTGVVAQRRNRRK